MSILNENLILFGDLPKHLPKKNGKRVSKVTTWRWKAKGVAGVRLEVAYIGGTPYTSLEAIERFHAAVTEAKTRKLLEPTKRPSRSSKRPSKTAHVAAKKILAGA